MRRIAWICLAVLHSALVGGCSRGDAPMARLEDYATRVERASGFRTEQIPAPALRVYPGRRDRIVPLDEIRINFLELLDFWRCDFGGLISERNSAMGKVMPVSLRLRYEVKFLGKAHACWRRVSGDPDLPAEFKEHLGDVVRAKREALPGVFWNATFGSPEMAAAFSLSGNGMNAIGEAAFVNSKLAIEYFENVGYRLQGADPAIDSATMESHYYALQLHRYGGRTLRALAQTSVQLERAAGALESLARQGPLCRGRIPVRKALILENVFRKFYAARAGRDVSRLHSRSRLWLSAINDLVEVQRVAIPRAFAAYRTQMLSLGDPRGLWHRFRSAVTRHTQAWQNILEQCGLAPGRALDPERRSRS